MAEVNFRYHVVRAGFPSKHFLVEFNENQNPVKVHGECDLESAVKRHVTDENKAWIEDAPVGGGMKRAIESYFVDAGVYSARIIPFKPFSSEQTGEELLKAIKLLGSRGINDRIKF